jgi:hypothetical protein
MKRNKMDEDLNEYFSVMAINSRNGETYNS